MASALSASKLSRAPVSTASDTAVPKSAAALSASYGRLSFVATSDPYARHLWSRSFAVSVQLSITSAMGDVIALPAHVGAPPRPAGPFHLGLSAGPPPRPPLAQLAPLPGLPAQPSV